MKIFFIPAILCALLLAACSKPSVTQPKENVPPQEAHAGGPPASVLQNAASASIRSGDRYRKVTSDIVIGSTLVSQGADNIPSGTFLYPIKFAYEGNFNFNAADQTVSRREKVLYVYQNEFGEWMYVEPTH